MRDACTVGACAAAIVNHAPFKSTGLKVLDCREISRVVVDVTFVATLTGVSSILRTIGPHSPALLNATSAVTVGFEVVTAATQDTFGVTVAISSPSFGNQKGYCTPPVGFHPTTPTAVPRGAPVEGRSHSCGSKLGMLEV